MDASNAGTSTSTGTLSVDMKDREIIITRIFDAPRELVWEAWTKPENVARWWGPKGFTTTIHEMDVRPGGVWRHTMHGPDGTDYPNNSTFIEVVKPERIVYSHGGAKQGERGVTFQATWTFEAQGEKTKLTLRQLFPSVEMRDHVVKTFHAIEGAKQTLGRLAEDLAATQRIPEGTPEQKKDMPRRDLLLERVFDAPRDLVWKAWTDPKHLAQWWGPAGFTNPVCEADARAGGAWHIVMRSPDGIDYPCGGEYREVVAPERLVFTNNATDSDGNNILDGLTTVIFADHGSKTKLTLQTSATALVDYAAEYLKGMEAGWTQSLERLAEKLVRS